jgi:hypothetical protein
VTDNTDIGGRDWSRPALPARSIAWTVLRVVGSVAVLGVVYYLLPLDRASAPVVGVILVAGLTMFVTLLVVQVRLIVRSPFPGMQGIEALATGVPFFLLLFASAYVAMSELSPESFSAHLSHADGLYFTVTVFSTVGFGDIVAKSETARLVVTGQMIADLIVVGVAIKIVVGAVRHGLRRRAPAEPRRE